MAGGEVTWYMVKCDYGGGFFVGAGRCAKRGLGSTNEDDIEVSMSS